MNENAKKWLAALRSGKYKQGQHTTLAVKNDIAEMSFGEIADLIESEPKGLFVEETK